MRVQNELIAIVLRIFVTQQDNSDELILSSQIDFLDTFVFKYFPKLDMSAEPPVSELHDSEDVCRSILDQQKRGHLTYFFRF